MQCMHCSSVMVRRTMLYVLHGVHLVMVKHCSGELVRHIGWIYSRLACFAHTHAFSLMHALARAHARTHARTHARPYKRKRRPTDNNLYWLHTICHVTNINNVRPVKTCDQCTQFETSTTRITCRSLQTMCSGVFTCSMETRQASCSMQCTRDKCLLYVRRLEFFF